MNAFVKDVPVTLSLQLTDPLVLAGVVVGAMLPYLFGAFTMLSVRKAADAIIVEVQDQFANIPGLLEGKEGVKPDTKKCVDNCTIASVKEMILPGLIAVMMPPCVGLLVGANALGGMLVGSISSGFMLAVMMSNAGGAWDNAKKFMEIVQQAKAEGQPASMVDQYKATVVGDTVGDPFKDTSGPALNILIKLMSMVSLVIAPLLGKEDWNTVGFGFIPLVLMIIVSYVCYKLYWQGFDDKIAAQHEALEQINTKPAATEATEEKKSGEAVELLATAAN